MNFSGYNGLLRKPMFGRNFHAGVKSMTSSRPPAFFLADHLALDFVNTAAAPQGTLIEWLGDGNDLVDWLEEAGVIEPVAAARLKELGSDVLDDLARQARKFRHWLRGFVTARLGKPLRTTTAALAPLNEVLSRENSFQRVETTGRGLMLGRVHRLENPAELLQPIAAAAADLICHHDFRLIRSCEGSACTLMFLDRTKAHGRRWCSMAVCGNRAKAAAHRARARNEA
jgi:predicted RNA-binding Zn ribbon-like protein